MRRRQFLTLSTLTAATRLRLLADLPMPTSTLGQTGMRISRYVVGGYHMNVKGEETALSILRRARELGVNFFDSANQYHKGESDRILGKAFGTPAERQKIMLMTKCDLYSRDAALKLLEEQLQRMKTDYLDLWQCHQVSEMKEVDQIFGPRGALEAFVQARKQGKVRHIGFTGHRDPAVHLRMLEASEWETVQMPINLIDPHYLSFITNVLPVARRKGLGVLAMKSNAMGSITRAGVAKIEACLRFTASQDVDTVVSGAETVEQLEQNVLVVKTLRKMTPAEISELLGQTKKGQTGVKIERYKRPPETAAWKPHVDGE